MLKSGLSSMAAVLGIAMSAMTDVGQSMSRAAEKIADYGKLSGRNRFPGDKGKPGDKLPNSIGKIGLGMHAAGRNALGGGTVSPKKDIPKGHALTLSVRDKAMLNGTSRRSQRTSNDEVRRRMTHLKTGGRIDVKGVRVAARKLAIYTHSMYRAADGTRSAVQTSELKVEI